MNPVTKQMWDTLPEIATPDLIEALATGKADAAAVTAALNAKVDKSAMGMPDGTAQLDADALLELFQFPEVVFNDDKSFSKFGALTTGPGQGRWYPRYPGIIKGVLGYLELAPQGAPVTIDIRKNNVSVFPGSDRLIIAANTNFSEYTFTTFPTFTRGDFITVYIDSVGSTVTGQTLSLQVEYAYKPE